MIAAVTLAETRALLRDGRLWGLGLALMLLFVVMLATASQQRQRAEQERHQVELAARAQWDHQGEKHPHRAAHFGLYAFKPRSALASLDPGIDAHAGQALWLEPHKRNLALFAPAVDAAPSLGLGDPVPAFILLALVPLLVVLLGHGSVTRERETDTLRMLHACGMPGRPLLVGKWLGLSAGLAIVLAPALAMGAWLIVDRHNVLQAALLLAALVTYLGIWAALTVLVSARCQTSRGALLVLIALWVGAVFVVPRLGAAIVERIDPLPTGEAFWSAIHRDIEQGLPGDSDARQRLKAFDARLLTEHGVTRPEDLPVGANARRRLFRDAYATRIHALHFSRLWNTQLRQQALLRGLTAVSPFPAMQGVSAALAGTDLAHRRDFEDAAERYRQRFTTLMDEWDAQATRGVVSYETRYAGDAQWQAMPPLRYAAPGVRFALNAAGPDFGVLALWLAAALGGLLLSARKLTP
ncbi:hypothetical protein CDN99_21450 [Roseateles aquatilis]|uniref:ABC transporter permease n=1 Tax=Roseateles aquatilis TaxID=431061 RepID=A0A246IZ78_9BURK|nr:DUF3526 domain-containing protein [Roseateles aquatilis]OWQ85653.1 hypothetical protein CDN99_21450 [Roseateles aquatilis]